MEHELLSKTNDKVFKELFTRNKSCMVDFLKCILNIPNEEFENLEFVDTHTRKGSALDGEYILDIKVKTKSNIIDVEMQVKRTPILEQRIIVYLANMVKDQSCEGFKYKDIKKSVSIIIAAEHNVKKDNRYFHKYNMRDEQDNSMFTDLLEVDLLELKKLPNNDDGTHLWDWLRFIKTNDKEEMEMLAQENPEIEKAYEALQDLSKDEAVRHDAQQREMYLQNELAINEEKYNQGMEKGIEKGMEKGKQSEKIEIAKNMILDKEPIEKIKRYTGLTLEEIEKLR
ncbi:hypothetical protein M9Y10_013531 [Tritrichomonas musculus]|uniref:Rpn family recombination-promoting nuclease/putative transposase n=1 Tax=Tritrichomonas musculus TaxID=1915356 RepID=A0ABR2GNT0_9EUKA